MTAIEIKGGKPPMAKMGDGYGNQEGDEDMIGGEQCLPLSMLAQPDEQDQMQTPSVGDTGSMTVDYTLVRIDGDNAYIKPTAINGQPLPEQQQQPTPEDEDQAEGDSLRNEANQMGRSEDETAGGAAA